MEHSENDLILQAFHCHIENDLEKARSLYEQVIALNPDRTDALNNLALIYQKQNDLRKAEIYYQRAIALNPEYSDALNNLGTLYKIKNDIEKAQKCYERAIAIDPDHVDVLSNLGAIYRAKNDLVKAKNYYERAVAINPDHIDALNNLGTIHQINNNLQKAEEYYQKATELNPLHPDAFSNLGVLYKAQNELKKAQEFYERAISLDPNNTQTLLNLSLLYLIQKKYKKGFALYIYRHNQDSKEVNIAVTDIKRYIDSASRLSDKKLYINSEQGFGDAIQYIRFVSKLVELGAEIVCCIFEPLRRLFSYNFKDIRFITSKNTQPLKYDFSLLDITYILNTTYDTIPKSQKYIDVDEKDLKSFVRINHLTTDVKKIGFAFKGSPTHHNDHNRSIDLELLLKNFMNLQKNVQFFSLQYDISEEEKKLLNNYNIMDLGSQIEDFYDTAVMVKAMDMIISIDSSLVHLSGAMGKRSLLILPYSPDWRWGIDESRTNWYDSVKIFRQNKIFDWSNVLCEVTEDIKREL